MDYVYYNLNPYKNHVRDCVYRGVAYFLKETWKSAVKRLVYHAIKDGYVNFNYTTNIVSFMENQEYKRHKAPQKGMTVREFGDNYAQANEVYMIHVVKPQHITIIDGQRLYDIWDCRECVMDWYFKRDNDGTEAETNSKT